MTRTLCSMLIVFLALSLVGPSVLSAQVSITGILTGTVTDPAHAAIVGANISAKDNATGAEYTTKSGADGHFVIANLTPSIYNVTVTAAGFKKGVFRDVKVIVGQTYDLSAGLELGEVSNTVVVEAGQEVIETQTATVGANIVGKSITQLPFTSRDVLDLATLMPGAQSPGRPRQSSFVGLPKGSINITYDGINAQDNLLKSSDGFFTNIRPRVDAIEEFSISTATQGAEQASEGAVQIRFTTKRGSNDFHGGVWEYLRNDGLNSNYYFNTLSGAPRQLIKLNQFGYKLGGPILKDKLFFFTDFDFYRNPQSVTRTRTILTDAASQGLYTYAVTAVPGSPPAWVTCNAAALTCTANLLQLAAAGSGGPFASTIDPVVGNILKAVNSSVSGPGVRLGAAPSLFQRSITFNNPSKSERYFPDFRFDWNMAKNHQLELDYHYSKFNAAPDTLNSRDPSYPVAPFNTNIGSQLSNRNLFAAAWRWNIGSNKSNELRFGMQSAPINFSTDLNLSIYPYVNTNLGSIQIRPRFVANSATLTNLLSTEPFQAFTPSGRNGALGQLIETLSWSPGKHNMALGMTWTEQRYNDFGGDSAVANVGLGVDSADPAFGIFGAGSLPGASTSSVNDARNLYGVLVGRVAKIPQNATNAFLANVYLDPATRQFRTGVRDRNNVHQREFGFYGTDSWRLRPSLTFSYGLRWEYQGAPVDVLNKFFQLQGGYNGLFGISGNGNLFAPGILNGSIPSFVNDRSKRWWSKDLKDFAPSIGLAWQPTFHSGWGRKMFGDGGQTVFRGGYSITYTREGLNNFFTITQGNPGFRGTQTLQPVQSSPGSGQFLAGSLQLQNLNFTNVKQTPQSFVDSFPIDPAAGQSVNAYRQDLKVPRVQSWSFGIQRQLTANMVLEVRYVGNHATGLWRQDNINEVNIFENGFLTEFNNAVNNLRLFRQANPGCTTTCSFANSGIPGQVAVPILTATFTGSKTGSQTNSNFTNAGFINNLDSGLAGTLANSLSSDFSRWTNLKTAGYPSNFWVVNPDARGGAFRFSNSGQSTYNALQLEMRRRPAKGLTFGGNYTWSKSLTNYFANRSDSLSSFDTLRYPGRDKGPAPFDIRHAFKLQLIYELPFGPGRKWNSTRTAFNRLMEGWEFNTITRLQSGRITQITGGLGGSVNQNDGGVQFIGLTQDQLQSMLGIQKTTTPAPGAVFYVPARLLDNNRQKANSTFLAACSTPGTFCSRVFVTGPQFFRADWSLAKRTRITERVNFELRAELLNAFNNANFLYQGNADAVPSSVSVQSNTFGRILDAYQDFSTTDDPGGRIIQLVFRINF